MTLFHNAVTRIRTWVTAATTQGTNHYTITASGLTLSYWQRKARFDSPVTEMSPEEGLETGVKRGTTEHWGRGKKGEKRIRPRQDSNLQSSDPKSDAFSIRPRGHKLVAATTQPTNRADLSQLAHFAGDARSVLNVSPAPKGLD